MRNTLLDKNSLCQTNQNQYETRKSTKSVCGIFNDHFNEQRAMALSVSWAEKLIRKTYTRRGVPRSYRAAVCCTTARERMHLWEYKQPVESLALGQRYHECLYYGSGKVWGGESLRHRETCSIKTELYYRLKIHSKAPQMSSEAEDCRLWYPYNPDVFSAVTLLLIGLCVTALFPHMYYRNHHIAFPNNPRRVTKNP